MIEITKHELSEKIANHFILMLNSQREVIIPRVGILKVSQDKKKNYTFIPYPEFDKEIRY